MKASFGPISWFRIKLKSASFVKPAGRRIGILYPALFLFPLASALASPTSVTSIPAPDSSQLPEINARTFELRISRLSRSHRVYLLDDVAQAKPRPGKILLFRRQQAPIMAFRVLKSYPEKGQFAAKKVRIYSGQQDLETNGTYQAVEKLGDVVMPLPAHTAQDKADLKELEGSPQPEPLPPPAPPAEENAPPPALEDASEPLPEAPPEVPGDSSKTTAAPPADVATNAAPADPNPAPPPPPVSPDGAVGSTDNPEPAPPLEELPPPAEQASNPPPANDLPAEIPPEGAPTDASKTVAANDKPEELPPPSPPPTEGADTAANAAPAPEEDAPAKPQVAAYDPELDAATSSPAKPAEDENDDLVEDEVASITVEEPVQLDPHKQWLTAGLALIRNYTKGTGDNTGNFEATSYTAGGFRYGLTTRRTLLFKGSQIQDSLTPELGIFLYKSLQDAQDTYTVMPILGTLRYNLVFGDTLTLFGYAGFLKNFVVAAFQPQDQTLSSLNSFFPAIGAGLLFRVGPNWDTRIDFGTDVLSLGLVLRF